MSGSPSCCGKRMEGLGTQMPQSSTVEELEFLIQLQQLEGTAGPPALFLGQPVVHIPFVLR